MSEKEFNETLSTQKVSSAARKRQNTIHSKRSKYVIITQLTEIKLFDINFKFCKTLSFEEVLDFISQERNPSDCYVLMLIGLDDISIQTIRRQYDLHPVIDSECSNSWLNNKDSLMLFEDYFLLTINDADNVNSLETPVSLKMVVFKTLMIIFAEDELYCINKVFKKDLSFSCFPAPQSPNKPRKRALHQKFGGKVKIEVPEEQGCTMIESIFHKLLEAIYSRLELLIIQMSEEADKCMSGCSELGVSDRIEFVVTLAISKKKLIYLEEIIEPKSKLFGKLLDCKFFTDYIKHYFSSLESRTAILVEQIQNSKVLVKTAEKIYSQSIDNTLAISSQKLNEITKIFSSVSTLFLPITLVAGLFGMNVEVPWQFYDGLEPFIGILTISFVLFLSFVIFFKYKGWM